MPRIDFASIGLVVDEAGRTARRADRQVKLTATQAMILAWLDGCAQPTLEFCCDENWESVDPEWVAGQIEKLAKALQPLELTLALDEDDMIRLGADEGPGAPLETSSPSIEAGDVSRADDLAGRAAIAGVATDVHADLLARQDADRARIAELEIERDQAWADLAEAEGRLTAQANLARQLEIVTASLTDAEAEVARLREAAQGQLIIVNQAREEIAARERAEAELGHVRAALASANDRNADLAARLEQTLKSRLAADRDGSAAPQEPARDAPLALAPRHLTLPVSEALYRWLEGVALRNRCSPENVASRLLIAFRRTASDEAGTRGRAA